MLRLGLPDRRSEGRGWPRREHLGSLLPRSRAGEDGETGEIACDFYHRYREDIALMRELGLDALPLLDRLAARPARGPRRGERRRVSTSTTGWSTSCSRRHPAVPDALPLGSAAGAGGRGGWPSRETAEAFADYAEASSARLGDRVERLDRRTTSRSAPPGSATGSATTRRAHQHAGGARRRAPRAALARLGRRTCCGATPGRRGRHRARLLAASPRERRRRRSRGRRLTRRGPQPMVLRSAVPRLVSGGHARALRRRGAARAGRRPRDDFRAARLPRSQQLLADSSFAPTRTGGVPIDVRSPTRAADRMGWEVYPRACARC